MLRLTTGRLPANLSASEAAGLPFATLVSPLAPSPAPPAPPTPHAEIPQKDVDKYIAAAATEASQIPRCSTCTAYLSACCTISVRSWHCSICTARNSLPSRYTPAVRAGASALHYVPEASRDVYDIPFADQLAITPVAYIFVIDVNGDAAYLDAARVALRKALDVVDGESLVGVMLYGDSVGFVDARSTGMVRRFSPLDTELSPLDVLAADQWLRPSGPLLTDTLMPILGQLTPVDTSKDMQHALGPAIRAALDMVEVAELTAARVVVIAAGEPNVGDGSLHMADRKPTDNNHFPTPVSRFYADQGARASLLGAIVDLYVVGGAAVDVASISPLAQVSGGRLLMYEDPEATLAQDVWQHLNDPAVVRGLLRIRTSSDFSVGDVYGCGLYRDGDVQDVFRLACHGHSSTLGAEFVFSGADSGVKRRVGDLGCMQVAFRGVFIEPGVLPQRVLRVETLLGEVTESAREIGESADANAIATIIFHKAIAAADENDIGRARVVLKDWLVQLVARAGGDEDGNVDASLSRCEALGPVPRLVFGLVRSFLFREEAVSGDMRMAVRCIWEDLDADLLAAAAYPQLVSFSNLDEKTGREVMLSSEAVKECGDGILMLDAFSEVIIYYTANAGRELVFPPPESSMLMRVRAGRIRDRPLTPKIVVCREGTAKDRWFKSLLIEDAVAGTGGQSFAAFMDDVVEAAKELLKPIASAE